MMPQTHSCMYCVILCHSTTMCYVSTTCSASPLILLVIILSLQGKIIPMTRGRMAEMSIKAVRMVARARALRSLPPPRLPLPRLLHLRKLQRTLHPRAQLPRILPRALQPPECLQRTRGTVHHPQLRPGRGGVRVIHLSQQLKGAKQTTALVSQSCILLFDTVSSMVYQSGVVCIEL